MKPKKRKEVVMAVEQDFYFRRAEKDASSPIPVMLHCFFPNTIIRSTFQSSSCASQLIFVSLKYICSYT